MNKWIPISICGMIVLAATGCSSKEAAQATNSPAVVASTPTPAVTAAPATPTPAATATVAAPAATAVPAASASPAATASATPQPQAAATPSPAQPTPAQQKPTPAPTATPAPTPTPSPSATPQPTVSATTSSSEKAELLYKNNCLACHGAGLTGDYGPNLTKVGSRKTKDQIVTQIMNGKTEMPPFKDTLKADEVEALANWLAAMK